MTFKNWFQLVVAILICEGVGFLGAVFTVPEAGGWYASLVKPTLNPPSWVFGPVWTTLYFLMGVAVFLVWRQKVHSNILQNIRMNVRRGVRLFALQLVLNALWSPIFFGMHNPALAFADLVLLALAIAATIVVFMRISSVAAWLMALYLAWVSFALYLNLTIVLLNP
ncbi:MAG: tryptophan-rich sensory protein [Patescibacteria group bacterium]|nr:tryptophan-rich sensory protein [Patescibacteria group bacterium]